MKFHAQEELKNIMERFLQLQQENREAASKISHLSAQLAAETKQRVAMEVDAKQRDHHFWVTFRDDI